MSFLSQTYKHYRGTVGVMFKCTCCGRHVKSKRSTLHNPQIKVCQKCSCATRQVKTPALCTWGCEDCPLRLR